MTAQRRIACALIPAITTLTVTLAAPPHALAEKDCPAIDAVAIPGTTETASDADPHHPVGVLGTILESIRKHTKLALSTYYTPYPATIIGGTDNGGYRGSKDAGIDNTNNHLKTVAHRCPKTRFLLTGYSQGADAAGDVAAAIGNNHGAIPADKLLGVALLADPSQAPTGQPTIGLSHPGMGFAGVRTGGFGSLTQRNRILSLCAPLDYYCNLPQNDLVMRFIGHLGSALDFTDPAGSAQKLATMFMAGLVAPATAAISQILKLVADPGLIPHLVQRGIMFAKALAEQLFWLAGPQVAATASALMDTATQVINLIRGRQWTAIPALITSIATKATAVGNALNDMQRKTDTINTNGFASVGTGLATAHPDFANLATAVLNAITTATGGIGLTSTGIFGPTFAQFSPATVISAFKHFAEFINGNYHCNYDTTPLDPAGHTGVQLVQRYFMNQLNSIV